MNLLKWLKNKAGKMPISFAQAAGLTAVVGAAGFAAMSYLSSPTNNDTTFMPPSAYEQQGDVVYISQGGGGGQYESNGEVGSSFRATQSDSIRLANQQFERESQRRALEDTDVSSAYAGEESDIQMPKAYRMDNADLGLGMGDGGDKQLNGSLEMFSNLQNQLAGVGDAINNAQAAGQKGAASRAASGTSGQPAKLAPVSHNWGQGGLTRAGSGNGVSNTFAIQDSGKNQGGSDKNAAAAMAQVGDVMADARAAMAKMQEGSRMRSRASFGQSDGFGSDLDARSQGSRRRYGNAKSELEWIRKQSAEIAKNSTNSANEGGRPFLANAQISGGLVVSGDNVTTGQGATSSDFNATSRSLRGIKAGLGSVQSTLEERTKKRHDLRKWMWWALPLALVTIPLIGAFASIGRMGIPIVSAIAWVCAAVLAALTLWPTIKLLAAGISYAATYGKDAYATMGMVLGGMLTAGVGVALAIPAVGSWLAKLPMWTLGAAAGIGFGGATTFKFLSERGDGYTDEELDDNLRSSDIDKNAEKLKGENK